MSSTVCTYPLVAMVSKADEIIGANRVWRPKNRLQKLFLSDFYDVTRGEIYHIPEIESIAAWSADEINQFLKGLGYRIKLDEFENGSFGVASSLILPLEWLQVGKKEKITAADGKKYDGVRMEAGLQYFTSLHHPNPIVRIATLTGDRLYATVMETAPRDFDLTAITVVQQLQGFHERTWDYGDLVIPMVDLDDLVDVGWLVDMETTTDRNKRAWIGQAKQQTQFKLNEMGALLKSAAAVEVMTESFSIPKPDCVIDRPFLTWIERPGLANPLFAGYITQENWRNPGNLKK